MGPSDQAGGHEAGPFICSPPGPPDSLKSPEALQRVWGWVAAPNQPWPHGAWYAVCRAAGHVCLAEAPAGPATETAWIHRWARLTAGDHLGDLTVPVGFVGSVDQNQIRPPWWPIRLHLQLGDRLLLDPAS